MTVCDDFKKITTAYIHLENSYTERFSLAISDPLAFKSAIVITCIIVCINGALFEA